MSVLLDAALCPDFECQFDLPFRRVFTRYAQVSRTVIRILDCHSFPAEGVSRLKAANYALICWSGPRHSLLVILSVIFTAVYAAGFPIGLFAILCVDILAFRFMHEGALSAL